MKKGGIIMGKLKTTAVVAASAVVTAVLYEVSLTGSRALLGDVEYLRQPKPPVKKHWWSRSSK